jgi:hypothetical protein
MSTSKSNTTFVRASQRREMDRLRAHMTCYAAYWFSNRSSRREGRTREIIKYYAVITRNAATAKTSWSSGHLRVAFRESKKALLHWASALILSEKCETNVALDTLVCKLQAVWNATCWSGPWITNAVRQRPFEIWMEEARNIHCFNTIPPDQRSIRTTYNGIHPVPAAKS